MRKKTLLLSLVGLSTFSLLFFYLFGTTLLARFFAPTPTSLQTGLTQETAQQKIKTLSAQQDTIPQQDGYLATLIDQPPAEPIQLVAENLSVPWEIAFLPDTTYLVTERPGQLLRIYPDAQTRVQVEGVVEIGEGGLMGMALDPDFDQNNYLYLYLTSRNGDQLINRVERYTFDTTTNTLSDRLVILDTIPGAQYHDGGRIAFGPDDTLYIATGDASQVDLAQDPTSLAGKILRIRRNGTIPPDNPSDTAIYSLGHRNPQGLAWDSQDQLWISEHGPSGLQSGFDEINLILPGGNYGWPVIQGKENRDGMIVPAIQSGKDETWAPAGMAIVADNLFFTGLRGASLYQSKITDSTVSEPIAHFREEFGRLRFVRFHPDGWLYIGTSNTDGRGTAATNDDRVIRIHLSVFELD